MKKLIVLTLTLVVALTGCGTSGEPEANQTTDVENMEDVENEEEPLDVKVVMPYGTPTLSSVKMVTENPVIDENVTVTYELIEATDVLSATLINNEADIAIVPTNLAATLYNKDTGYQLAGTSVWGILYVASSEEISDIEDLKGKTIGAMGRDMTPDAILRYILDGNNINADEDLTIEYFSGSSELASNFIAGEINTEVAPEPVLTNMLSKRSYANVVMNLQDEWANLTGYDSYPQASLIISSDLINNNPEFVTSFIEEYDSSVDWVNENPQEAGEYYEKLDIGLNAQIIEEAIPNCSLDFVDSVNAKESINGYLQILYDFNPKLLGGSMVDENLYFEQ